MNFLAHYVIATRYLTPVLPLPMYIAGMALPDLLPLATRRSRLRPHLLDQMSMLSSGEATLQAGVLVHLATDAAFHKTRAFAEAQAKVSSILRQTPFDGIRVRRFFLAHVLTELALDAVLLRADLTVADGFYANFADADRAAITRWTEAAVAKPLPELPAVLTRFARSRYLYSYANDAGVATGLSRLCGRARQDTFEGGNYARLVAVVGETVAAMGGSAEALLAETAAAFYPPTTPK